MDTTFHQAVVIPACRILQDDTLVHAGSLHRVITVQHDDAGTTVTLDDGSIVQLAADSLVAALFS